MLTFKNKNVNIILVRHGSVEKTNVVIIAKRIHLFPFRTQKLSSLALMVLGGQPPGRVRHSHVIFFYEKDYKFKRQRLKT